MQEERGRGMKNRPCMTNNHSKKNERKDRPFLDIIIIIFFIFIISSLFYGIDKGAKTVISFLSVTLSILFCGISSFALLKKMSNDNLNDVFCGICSVLCAFLFGGLLSEFIINTIYH